MKNLQAGIEEILKREETEDLEPPYRCLPAPDLHWIKIKSKVIADYIRDEGYVKVDPESKTCPFCGEPDFDNIGLRHHLLTYCEVFNDTLTIEEERKLKTKGDISDG